MKKLIQLLLAVAALAAAVLGLCLLTDEKPDTEYVTIYDDAGHPTEN